MRFWYDKPASFAVRFLAHPCLLATRATGVAVLIGSTLFAAPVSAQNMVFLIIQSQCAKAMNADFKAAGKIPPPGMVQSTCHCVAQRIEQRDSIDVAKTFCVNQNAANTLSSQTSNGPIRLADR